MDRNLFMVVLILLLHHFIPRVVVDWLVDGIIDQFTPYLLDHIERLSGAEQNL